MEFSFTRKQKNVFYHRNSFFFSQNIKKMRKFNKRKRIETIKLKNKNKNTKNPIKKSFI